MLKPVDNDEPITFTIDTATYERCKAFLRGISLAGRTEAAKAINMMLAKWEAEIKKHMPVGVGGTEKNPRLPGLLKNSVQISPAAADGDGPVVGAVGTNVEYGKFIEMGTKYIAGGAVQQWKFGEPLILMWPAKMANRKKVRLRSDGTPMSREELMPPFRGSWQLIEQKMLDMLRNRLARLMQQGKVTG